MRNLGLLIENLLQLRSDMMLQKGRAQVSRGSHPFLHMIRQEIGYMASTYELLLILNRHKCRYGVRHINRLDFSLLLLDKRIPLIHDLPDMFLFSD